MPSSPSSSKQQNWLNHKQNNIIFLLSHAEKLKCLTALTIVPTVPMTCQAFTDTLDPCPMACSSSGTDVCESHANFYVPETWFEKYIFSADREHYYFSSCSKIQLIYKRAILEQRIMIRRDHFRDLDTTTNPEGLVDYYLLCCSQPQVDPFWSSTLFTATVKTIVSMHMADLRPILEINPNLLYRFLDPLFNSSFRSFDYMVVRVLLLCTSMSSSEANDTRTQEALGNLDGPVSLLQYINYHPKFESEILLGHSVFMENLCSTVLANKNRTTPIATFLESLPEQREFRKKELKEKNRMMREELSYAVSKPEMFLDHQAYSEFKMRWLKN